MHRFVGGTPQAQASEAQLDLLGHHVGHTVCGRCGSNPGNSWLSTTRRVLQVADPLLTATPRMMVGEVTILTQLPRPPPSPPNTAHGLGCSRPSLLLLTNYW